MSETNWKIVLMLEKYLRDKKKQNTKPTKTCTTVVLWRVELDLTTLLVGLCEVNLCFLHCAKSFKMQMRWKFLLLHLKEEQKPGIFLFIVS